MPLNQLAPGPLASGGASLFGALMGGDATQEAARVKAQTGLYAQQAQEATLDSKITQAMLERDKRKAQQGMAQDIVANGGDPLSANVQANAMIAGFANLEQAQKYDIRGQALNAALADPGLTPTNARLAVLSNKPVSSLDIVGGNEIRGRYGDNPTASPTQQGLAEIVARGAQANASNAQAGMSNAHARVYGVQADAGGWNPNSGSHGGKMLTPGEPTVPVEGTPWQLPSFGAAKPWSMIPTQIDAPVTMQPAKDAAVGNQPSPLAPSAPASGAEARALSDAKAAIATGRISKADARARLIKNGLASVAEQL